MVSVIDTADFSGTPVTTSGGLPLTAPVGSVIVVSTTVNNTANVSVVDSEGHFWSTHAPDVPTSGTVSSQQMFWTTVMTANPEVTVGRDTSGALAVDVVVLDEGEVGTPVTASAQGDSLDLPALSGAGIALLGLSALQGAVATLDPAWSEVHTAVAGTRRQTLYSAETSGSVDGDVSFAAATTASMAALVVGGEAPPAPLLGVWNGSALESVEVLGVWNGTSVDPVEVLGMWDGTQVVSVEGGA